jgi:hypothetical protein
MQNITTIEALTSSVRVGQETLLTSCSTDIKKSANLGQFTKRYPNQPPALLEDLRHDARTDRLAAFADGEANTFRPWRSA